MATTQTLNYVPNSLPTYAFLSKPPPPQKKRPTQPPPATPTLRSFSAIATWAAHVQPGSPGSPGSIRRRSSLSRRPSLSGRRPSISLTPSPRSTSHSFLLVRTPTSSAKDFNIDLTNLGYTSVFVHLPNTPSTPAAYITKALPMHVMPDPIPAATAPARTPKRFRSLSILRPRNRSGTLPASPTKSIHATKFTTHTKSDSATSIAKRKKALYASSKPKHAQLPPSLASELALMQFADGGSMNANVKRLMEAQARAAAPTGTKVCDVGVGDVYRDGKGGVWWDREEEMEYVHLLGGTGETTGKWVSFGGEVKDIAEDSLALASLAGLDRRDSSTSTNSNTSLLDPSNIVKPAEDDAALVTVPLVLPVRPALASAPAPKTKSQEGKPPLLCLPSRARARAHHLHAKPGFFLLDLQAFNIPSSPPTPASPVHAHITLRPQKSFSPVHSSFTYSSSPRLRGKARRRPAPLKIAPCVPLKGVGVDADGDVEMAEEGRREFLEDTFVPTPPPAPVDVVIPVRSLQVKKKASRLGLGSLFGRK